MSLLIGSKFPEVLTISEPYWRYQQLMKQSTQSLTELLPLTELSPENEMPHNLSLVVYVLDTKACVVEVGSPLVHL